MADVSVYTHKDGRTQGAYVGSELEKLLARAEDWLLDSAPVEPESVPEPVAPVEPAPVPEPVAPVEPGSVPEPAPAQ